MIPDRIKKFLDEENATFEVIGSTYSPNSVIAKAILVRASGKDVMVVLPETDELNLNKLAILLDEESLAIETEKDNTRIFPDCECHSLPALGRPYNIPCFIDQTVLDKADVILHGGTPTEQIKITSDEYWRLAEAEIGDFKA